MNERRDGRNRSSVSIGSTVEIVQKKDQRSGKRTCGVVAEILTNSASHPHGIKVRLRDGTVGRVAAIFGDDGELPGT
ncbi:MAG: YwbE family protein [Methanomicrobiales archaeon]|nr:YwbE family protein [Methanomicrobiales archaeon]MDD1668719.1 YwbE family protein [Methanomicrobiales archaeon]